MEGSGSVTFLPYKMSTRVRVLSERFSESPNSILVGCSGISTGTDILQTYLVFLRTYLRKHGEKIPTSNKKNPDSVM